MTDLTKKKCMPCQEGVLPLEGEELASIASMLQGGWKVIHDHHLEKEFSFPNYKDALEFTNRVGNLSEEEGHHPDIHLSWGKVRIVLWTHKINGLSEADFILAAKIDRL